MLNPEDIKQGSPLAALTAEEFRAILRAAEDARNTRFVAPLAVLDETLVLMRPDSFYATLSGASSPYSFTEKYGTTGGAWTTRVRTGTTNAYEVNGKSSLNGKTVLLRPGYPGEYLFQWVSEPAASCTGTLTVNVKCGGINRSGATVTITQGATTVTGTTNGSGNASLTPGASGTWNISVTLTGFQTYTGTFTFSCSNLTLNIVIFGATNTLNGQVRSICVNQAIPSATVEIRSGGTLYATTTTNSLGNWSSTFAGPGASYDVTFIKTGFSNLVVSAISLSCNGTVTVGFPNVTMLVDTASYTCFGCRGWDPLPHSSSISLTVSWAGGFTLTYSSTYNAWISSTYTYSGSGRIYTAADAGGTIGTTSATGVAATIFFYAFESTTTGGTGVAGFYAWCLKAPVANYIMSDAYVTANPAKVEQRKFWFADGDSPCSTSSAPMLVSFSQFMQPDINIVSGVTPGGTGSFTE